MAQITMDGLRKVAKAMGMAHYPIEIGSYEWAEWLLKAAGKDVPRSWPRSTPFYTINYKTLVHDYLERLIEGGDTK